MHIRRMRATPPPSYGRLCAPSGGCTGMISAYGWSVGNVQNTAMTPQHPVTPTPQDIIFNVRECKLFCAGFALSAVSCLLLQICAAVHIAFLIILLDYVSKLKIIAGACATCFMCFSNDERIVVITLIFLLCLKESSTEILSDSLTTAVRMCVSVCF